jgi:hypothetical protein
VPEGQEILMTTSPETVDAQPEAQPTNSGTTPVVVDNESPAIEEMTLSEVIGQIFRAPGETLGAFFRVITDPVGSSAVSAPSRKPPGINLVRRLAVRQVMALTEEEQAALRRDVFQLGLRIFAFLLALYGSAIMWDERTEQFGLNVALPYLLIAVGLWLVAEFASDLLVRVRQPAPQPVAAHVDTLFPVVDTGASDFSRSKTLWLSGLIISSVLAAFANANNRFTVIGVIAWVVSIVMVVALFAPPGWGWQSFWNGIRSVRLPRGWTLWVLLGIILVAAVFRFKDLGTVPPEMTSDHVEKILDAQDIVLHGASEVFFRNNGGREPIQFYLLALISGLPGLGFNFSTLKFLTVIEGLICIPLLWWMGREMIGEQEPELGNLVGVLLAALAATSSWHVMLSRLGLRIVLTVIFTCLVIVYLSRALRRNQRGDFIKAGLALGFGLYAYQSIRMLPIVIVLGVGMAIIFKIIGSRVEARKIIRAYIYHLAVLTVVAVVIFVPMMMFSLQYPNDFWRRTSGRLFGDELYQTTNEKGELVVRFATLEEQLAAFQNNIGKLLVNIRNALLMYNWKGDVAWITNTPNRPEMDMFAGSLLVVGLGAWLARMIRRRDPADWLMIPMIFIMLLPSALSVAYPIENPSATRTSGTLPEVYVFTALPLAIVMLSFKRLLPGWRGKLAVILAAGAILFFSLSDNWNSYFGDYYRSYLVSSPAPYTVAGQFLRGFAESDGSYGNAYMIAYKYWWDHRAIGIEAGRPGWPNGINDPDGDDVGLYPVDAMPGFLYLASRKPDSDPYRLDPNKDLLFFYSPQDVVTEQKLSEWFPNGYAQVNSTYKPGADFMTYRVPKLGLQGLVDFFVRTNAITNQ